MSPANLFTKRRWIAELARSKRETALTLLHHLIDLEWMHEAYELTRKDGATGIDGVTAEAFEADLQAHLLDLLERFKSGRYRAPPVRRSYIPKADGSQRPLGIPTFEDKVAQRAIVMVLEAVYEQDFPCPARTGSGPSARPMMRCARCMASSRGKGSTGCWMSTYASTSTRSRTNNFGRSSTSE
jgi:RNA-directed DNA polymerase